LNNDPIESLEISQFPIDDPRAQARQVWDHSHRLETGQHICRGVRQERGRVKKIRPAEDVQHRVLFIGQVVLAVGKRDEARDLLAPVYGRFTEGFDTHDLKEAKALLEEST